MNYSKSINTTGNSYGYSNHDTSKCWWCEPAKISEGVETFFTRPKAQENPIPLANPISANAGEKLKRCDFEYLNGVLFGQKIIIH